MELLRKHDREVPAENRKDSTVTERNITELLKNDDGGERIKELALSDSLTSSILLLYEIKTLKARLARELDMAEDRRKKQAKDHVELLAQLWEELRKIRAQFRIEAQLLGLIKPDEEDRDNARHR
jgi:hypothetical protein